MAELTDVLGDVDAGELRVRAIACGCAPECTTVYYVAAAPEMMGDLWVAQGRSFSAGVDFTVPVADALERPEQIVQTAALVGLPWRLVLAPRLAFQATVLEGNLPDWSERVPLEMVLGVRASVVGLDDGVGGPVLRVLRALEACREYARDVGGRRVAPGTYIWGAGGA